MDSSFSWVSHTSIYRGCSLGVVGRRRLRAQVTVRIGRSSGSCGWICGAQDGETAHERVIDRHEGTRVVELATVVGGAKHRHKLTTTEELIAIFYHLMGSTDEIDVVFLEELLDDSLAECVANTSIVLSPTRLAFLRIGPYQVTE